MGTIWKPRLGWIAAAVIAFAWFTSGNNGKSPPVPSQSVAPAPSVALQQNLQTKNTIAESLPGILPPESTTLETARDEPQTMYTKSRANLRENPNLKSRVLKQLEGSVEVKSERVKGEWHQVSYQSAQGWIHRDLLSQNRVIAVTQRPAAFVEPRKPPAAVSRSGQPSRKPYVGTCDCPYDMMRNGRACGGRSAYSKPGGRNPVCYL